MASHLDPTSMAASLRTAQDMKSGISNGRANAVIYYTQFAYPIVLLFLFIIAFAAHGIITANNESGPAVTLTVTGPGGKPLPNTPPPRSRRPKKHGFNRMKRLVFVWISIGQILTFLGNAVNIVVHALAERESGWWCGEATAVSV
jgi:ATP-binding cassette, subfamily B, vacuolar membrane transporter HMT1/ACLQ